MREYAWIRPWAAQVLVDEQRVQRRGVEAGQEHVDHDDQVDLAVLQPQRQVLVVVLELVGRGVEAGAEHGVVVLDRVLEEVARRLRRARRSRSPLRRGSRPRRPRWRRRSRSRPTFSRWSGGRSSCWRCELGCSSACAASIEAVANSALKPRTRLPAERVVLGALGLLVEVLQRVADDLRDPLRSEQRPLGVDRRDLLVGRCPSGT